MSGRELDAAGILDPQLRADFEVCRQLKSDPRTRAVPVIMLTARGEDVEREMHKFKRGKLKSGKGGKGGTVKSRKQAIAIGLSEARAKGKKVPRKGKAS